MKTKRNRLILMPVVATLFFAIFIGGCEDKYEGIEGVCPEVISTSPANNATSVPLNQIITVTFNEEMNPATFTPSSLTIADPNKSTTADVPGVITYSGETATFTPDNNLLPNTTYTGKVTPQVKDLMGNALQVEYIWTFSTGADVLIAPMVTCNDPADGSTNVVLNKVISGCFSEPMDPSTINTTTLTVSDGTSAVAGTVTYINLIPRFTPTDLLVSGTTYTVTFTTGMKNLAGTSLEEDFVWSFTTGTILAPTVTSTDPEDLETDVALDKVITANFSEEIDPASVTTSSFNLMIGSTLVSGTVDLDPSGLFATFTPSVNLLPDSVYTATITTEVQNLDGISVLIDYVWTFSTVAHLGPPVIILNSVARFGIISGVAVSNNAGASVINDLDVGIYPGFRSSITGFFDVDGGPGLINNGDFYAADDADPIPAMLLQAKDDLVAAYLFAEAATDPAPVTVAGDQGGVTLAPGIYKSTSTLLIQSGDLTLDAQGDVNAVWIFQIASDFTTVGGGPFPSSTGGNVILSGGAQAKNVFWQVGISATIGDYTSFNGNILALTSITMGAYSVAVGRMLCQNGAVTLTSTNTITKP